MRIDQQQRMVSHRVSRRNRNPVGPFGLGLDPSRHRLQLTQLGRQLRDLLGSVKLLQLSQIHPFDIPAYAAFRKRKRHPRLKVADDFRFHLRMIRQVEVQPVRPGTHQLLQPHRTYAIQPLQLHWIDE